MTGRAILLFVSLSLIWHAPFAQDTAALKVIYEFKYIRDLAQKDNPYISDMVLIIGNNKSHYCSVQTYNSNVKNGVLTRRSQQTSPINSASSSMVVAAGGPILRVGKYGVLIAEEIMKDFQMAKLEVDGRVSSRNYVIENDMPNIKWELKNDRKAIGKYTCQLAIGSYGGRQYEVWFTPDLPYRDGPWKLNGLPGLILEGHDTTNQVVFTFKEMSKGPDMTIASTSFLKDERSIPISLKSYNHIRAAFDSDPEGIMLAEHPEVNVYINPIDGSESKVKRIKKYNPIEID